jgi:hypothetical protein
MAQTNNLKGQLAIAAAVLVWLALCLTGFKILFDYGQTPGEAATFPPRWPTNSSIQRKPNQPTLVMFVHPQCPCTRASVGELATLMAHAPQKIDAHVLFLAPKGFSDNWVKSDLWQSAAAIPGVTTNIDPDGMEATRFHATTSGNIALYGSTGNLLFSGGITASRGHFGDNIGLDSAIASLSDNKTKPCNAAVFGCPLFGTKTGSE